ncbi:MAG: ATP-binding protein, partial [Gemmatimonadetes bacterium]|nr:ATP-binding protein [Gemmatimonadota bacterium]
MRFFNTAGPIRPQDHYHIPPLERLDLAGLRALIQQKKYFVLHAPRQTGKTSALLALRDLLNAEGHYRCAYVNFEVGQAAREDTERAMRAILGELALRARQSLQDEFVEEIWFDALQRYGPDGALQQVLSRWAGDGPTPLVLLIDEIDALVGDTLVSVLRQLRAGYDLRPDAFPQSVVLCGVRDVRDYRIQSTAENAIITGGSAFNIKARSLRLGDFSLQEVQTLLAQHTESTGQAFADEALDAVWRQTQGQPWLVNALADEACFSGESAEAWHRPVTAEAIRAAQEQLILRRETHLDQLADKLREERVRRVVEPLLSGGEARSLPSDDLMYVRDLGLVSIDDPV